MRVVGIDVTSSPDRGRPLVAADCQLEGRSLVVERLERWVSFDGYRAFLASPGPWVAGVDHPFGLPAVFVAAVGWPRRWTGYVGTASQLSRSAFRDLVTAFRSDRPAGSKHSRRFTDRLARAASPVNVVRPPVGLMFHAAAPLLLAAAVDVRPCRPARGDRTVVEAYPALVVRRLIGRRPYKGPPARAGAPDRPDRLAARADLVAALGGALARSTYGLGVRFARRADRDAAVADRGGDLVDAVLCALQAAWAARQPDLAVPPDADPDEGWIVDPALVDDGPG